MQSKKALKTLPITLCFIALTIGCGTSSTHPTDQVLEKRFFAREQDFDKLIAMSNEDSNVIRIAPDFTRLKNNWAWPRPESELGFSKVRWGEYKALFERLNLDAGLERVEIDNSVEIFLIASAVGMVNRGSAKGYAYSEKELAPTFNSLDENPIESEKRPKHGVVYKKLKTNWYLCQDW